MRKIIYLSLLFLVASLVSACGFRPIYGNHEGDKTPVSAHLNLIRIENIKDRKGQILRNHLIDRLYGKGRPKSPTTVLEISLASATADLGIQKDSTASRSEMNLSAGYVLKDMTGNTLISGTARSSVSFSKLNAQYGTLAAQQNAEYRALIEIGEEIVNRLSLYFAVGQEIAAERIAKKKAKEELQK